MNLNLTIQEIISMLGVADCRIEPSFLVKNITSLEQAGPDDLALVLDRGDQSVFDAVSVEKIKQSGAGILLTQREIVDGKRYLLVNDELAAFTQLVQFIEQRESAKYGAPVQALATHPFVSVHACIAQSAHIHPSASIAPGAVIGEKTVIGAHSVIGRDCQIGQAVVLHPGAKILDRCLIGDGTIIHAGAVIGSDGFGYQVTKTGLRKVPQIGIVRVGKAVEIGANCTIDRASFNETVIGNGVKIDNMVHIAHNVKIGDGCAILAQTGIAGSATIGIGTQIGGQVAIKDNVVIGNGVKIVSKSGVMQNIIDGAVVAGLPTMPFTQWKRCMVALNRLPEIVKLAGDVKHLIERQQMSFFMRMRHFFKKLLS